jgi:hypothetical protein
MTGYQVERKILRSHATQLDEYRDDWTNLIQYRILSAESALSPDAVTVFGINFQSAYDALLADYSTYVAGVRKALGDASVALQFTARTYGLAESAVTARMKAAQQHPKRAKSGGIEKLLP